MSIRHLNQTELSARWNISPRTLERWRWLGEGPRFLKLGGRVLYRLEDVEEFEAANVCSGADTIMTPARATGDAEVAS